MDFQKIAEDAFIDELQKISESAFKDVSVAQRHNWFHRRGDTSSMAGAMKQLAMKNSPTAVAKPSVLSRVGKAVSGAENLFGKIVPSATGSAIKGALRF